jgi:hypothetical protein
MLNMIRPLTYSWPNWTPQHALTFQTIFLVAFVRGYLRCCLARGEAANQPFMRNRPFFYHLHFQDTQLSNSFHIIYTDRIESE